MLWCACSDRSHGDIPIFHRNWYALWTEQQQSEVSAKTGFVFSNCRKCVCSFWLLSLFVIEMYCNNIQIILYRLVSSGVSADRYLVLSIDFENPCTFYVFFHFQGGNPLKVHRSSRGSWRPHTLSRPFGAKQQSIQKEHNNLSITLIFIKM